MRLRKLRVVAVLAVATAALAAPAVASPGKKIVKVGDYYFRPGKLTIRKGAKVTWKWVALTLHNVTVTSGPVKFHSPNKFSGTFSHVFTVKGTYVLHCTIHPFMTEKIVVR